jgi:UDP-N-acetylmuramate--alanine ligase
LERTGCEQAEQQVRVVGSGDDVFSNVSGGIHFIGVGGIGMSALAELLLARGYVVSGSDKEASAVTKRLEGLGLKFFTGHDAGNVAGAGAIVVSTAITTDNPEIAAAQQRNLPIWHRSQVLLYLSRNHKLVAISGTHGKTTTTGMVAQVLVDAGKDPSVVVGGIFNRIGSNARFGRGELFVAEADESDGTHTASESEIAVITNIEPDHLENYPGGIEQIKENFVTFANRSNGFALLCEDDAGCREIRDRIRTRVVTYGRHDISPDADYTYQSLAGFGMQVYQRSKILGELNLSVPGEHNKINALAAIAIGRELGIAFDAIADALSQFGGVARRFQILGTESGVTVVDDYAHHPTEVAATLQASKQYVAGKPQLKRVLALFQPHQPGRLRDLWDEFVRCFPLADKVLIADIYVARGKPIEGITSERFAAEITHPNVAYVPGSARELPEKILPFLNDGDLLLTIGAGDITKVGPEILRLLKQGHGNGTST